MCGVPLEWRGGGAVPSSGVAMIEVGEPVLLESSPTLRYRGAGVGERKGRRGVHRHVRGEICHFVVRSTMMVDPESSEPVEMVGRA